MPEQLGKIQKPIVEKYREKRKIFLLPLFYKGTAAPDDYVRIYENYWSEAEEHLEMLTERLGEVDRIYHESISSGGQEGMQIMEALNAESYEIASREFANGAELEVFEDWELLEETMDWERCILMGLISRKVREIVSKMYMESSKKRYACLSKAIDGTLKAREVGLLFARGNNNIPFPSDIEVFTVSPPALDDIYNWLREGAYRLRNDDAQGGGGEKPTQEDAPMGEVKKVKAPKVDLGVKKKDIHLPAKETEAGKAVLPPKKKKTLQKKAD